MDFSTYLILFVAAFAAGGINAVAGGGTFLTFPILILGGVPPVHANATNTIALWPGSMASAVAYRKELQKNKHLLLSLCLISFVGGTIGAVLLIITPESTFRALIPWLLLAATLIFTLGGRLTSIIHRATSHHPLLTRLRGTFARFTQFMIAVYGGYFGAGIGMLMLAMLQLMGLKHIHQMNAIKTVLASIINAIAVLLFIAADLIVWPVGLVMLAGGVLGGYAAAHLAQKLPPGPVRAAVAAYGWAMTAYFFLHG